MRSSNTNTPTLIPDWSSWFQKILPQSVGVRVSLAVNLLAVIFGMGFVIVDYRQEVQQRLADKSISLKEQAMMLHQAVMELRTRALETQQSFIDAVCERMSDDESPGHHIVVEIDRQVLQSRAHCRDSEQSLRAIRSACRLSKTGIEKSHLLVGQHHEAGITVYVAKKMSNVRSEIRKQAMLHSIGIALFGLLLAFAVNVAIHRLVHKPLRRLAKTIDSIAAGDYCKTNGRFESAELAHVASAVDSMSCSLAQAEGQRRAAIDRARRVQQHLLPKNGGQNGLEVAFFHYAAEDVAGDYVDVFPSPHGTSIICIADVVGHGIAPAMIAAMLKVLLIDASEVHDDPGEMMTRLNRRFTTVSLPEDFATVFLGVWTPARRALQYVSAGHEPALLVSRDFNVTLLKSTGPMIGLDATMSWETHQVQLAPGEYLAGWTDGITEAWGPDDRQFGRERLISLIKRNVQAGPKAVATIVERALKAHSRNRSLADDCTFVAVRFS